MSRFSYHRRGRQPRDGERDSWPARRRRQPTCQFNRSRDEIRSFQLPTDDHHEASPKHMGFWPVEVVQEYLARHTPRAVGSESREPARADSRYAFSALCHLPWQTASERWSTTRNSSPTGRAAVWLSWSVRTIARVTSTWGWYSGSSSLPQCRRGRSLRTQTEGSDGSRKKPVGPALTCDRREHDLSAFRAPVEIL